MLLIPNSPPDFLFLISFFFSALILLQKMCRWTLRYLESSFLLMWWRSGNWQVVTVSTAEQVLQAVLCKSWCKQELVFSCQELFLNVKNRLRGDNYACLDWFPGTLGSDFDLDHICYGCDSCLILAHINFTQGHNWMTTRHQIEPPVAYLLGTMMWYVHRVNDPRIQQGNVTLRQQHGWRSGCYILNIKFSSFKRGKLVIKLKQI